MQSLFVALFECGKHQERWLCVQVVLDLLPGMAGGPQASTPGQAASGGSSGAETSGSTTGGCALFLVRVSPQAS